MTSPERGSSGLIATHTGEAPTAEVIRATLQQRAAELARPIKPAPTGRHLEAVAFRLAGERYALETRFIRSVAKLTDLALLPGAPDPVYGVTLLRGMLVTVLDLRTRLGASTSALSDLSRVIVVGRERQEFGILADAAEGAVSLDMDNLAMPGRQGVHAGTLVRGVTPDAVLVLDGDAILKLAQGESS